MPDINKEFEFIMAVLKTGSITVNYDAASTMLGWNKKKTMNKMSDFRKLHDWPINKEAATTAKGTKANAAKRAANDDDGEGEAGSEADADKPTTPKKPTVKRVKTKAAKEEGDAAGENEGEGPVKKPVKKAPAKPRAKGKKAAKEEVVIAEEEFAVEENGEEEVFDA